MRTRASGDEASDARDSAGGGLECCEANARVTTRARLGERSAVVRLGVLTVGATTRDRGLTCFAWRCS